MRVNVSVHVSGNSAAKKGSNTFWRSLSMGFLSDTISLSMFRKGAASVLTAG
jgi:hypothetical protein